jgi:hypothetical protein
LQLFEQLQIPDDRPRQRGPVVILELLRGIQRPLRTRLWGLERARPSKISLLSDRRPAAHSQRSPLSHKLLHLKPSLYLHLLDLVSPSLALEGMNQLLLLNASQAGLEGSVLPKSGVPWVEETTTIIITTIPIPTLIIKVDDKSLSRLDHRSLFPITITIT